MENPTIEYSMNMTLRDWFAGKALTNNADWSNDFEKTAKRCYEIADALLLERSKGKGEK